MSTGTLRIRPAGDRAVLVEPADPDQLDALVDALRAAPPAGVQDLLPAAATVLLTLDAGVDPVALAAELRELDLSPGAPRAHTAPTPGSRPPVLVVPVHYDGADLAQVADQLRVDPATVIARHTAAVWRCRFVGFTAGFGYLTAPAAGLAVRRRDRSRTAVPAGAVALADGYSAIYPRRSPGGWQLIGRTDLAMWDLDRPQPALLAPGRRVRFTAVDR